MHDHRQRLLAAEVVPSSHMPVVPIQVVKRTTTADHNGIRLQSVKRVTAKARFPDVKGHIQGTWASKHAWIDEKRREQRYEIKGGLRKNGRSRVCQVQSPWTEGGIPSPAELARLLSLF